MGQSFPHLHVASAYSPHYGVTMPEALVDQTAATGADFLALTDRDGLYGAVKHVRACAAEGIRPGLGADLAVHDDEHRPLGRVTLLAHGGGGRGYAALCRAVSSAHESGRVPSIDRRRLATWAEGRTLTVLLGPLSDVGLAVERRDSTESVAGLRAWLRVMPIGSVTLEVVCHLAPTGQRGSVAAATRMLGLAEDTGTPAILSNAVRYGEPTDATTADLADATRLLTPLAQLEEPQANGQAWLKDAQHMRQVARMVVDAGARNPGALDQLLQATRDLADRGPAAEARRVMRGGRSCDGGAQQRCSGNGLSPVRGSPVPASTLERPRN
ncbi:PHP domain-containing protein [Cryobacterium sp. TMT4-10]|uniref:PHP domain-containing protein n=1 Tax=Cryobacterium sp. TMT4-10 TaxID=1259256 RepID=UPI00141AC16A|nr:PHP domain-containing protein [Cryobacterium sp. TMT4-10]